MPGRPVLARDPGPPPLGPGRRPFRPRPPRAPRALRSSAAPVGLPPRIPASWSQPALPLTVILLVPPGWGPSAVPLLPPCVSGPLPDSDDTYFGSSLILLPVLPSGCFLPLPPAAECSMLLVLCTFLQAELDSACQYFTYRNRFVVQAGGKCFHLGEWKHMK